MMGGISSLTGAQAKMLRKERMQVLAIQKYDEMLATREFSTSPSGEFEDDTRYRWEVESSATGIENLDQVTVRVTSTADENMVETVSGLTYTAPEPVEQPAAGGAG